MGDPVKGFAKIDEARGWLSYSRQYNTERKDRGLKCATPVWRRIGEAETLLEHLEGVYREANASHPGRSNGEIRKTDLRERVRLNSEKAQSDSDAAA